MRTQFPERLELHRCICDSVAFAVANGAGLATLCNANAAERAEGTEQMALSNQMYQFD